MCGKNWFYLIIILKGNVEKLNNKEEKSRSQYNEEKYAKK